MANGNFDLDFNQEREKLNTFFTQRACLSGYSRHLLDTILMDSQFEVQPKWFPVLETELAQLQSQAQVWFDRVAPPLTQLPQTYINAGNVLGGQFAPLRAAIEHLIDGNASDSEGDIRTITLIFNQMLRAVRAQGRVVADTDFRLKSYGSALREAIKAMTDGAASVNAVITVEKEAIIDCKNAIATLQSQLEADLRGLIGAAVVGGVGVVGAIVGVVLVVGSSTGVGAVITAIIGVVAAIAGVVTTALLAVNVVSDQEAIIKKQNELSADGRQLVALNGLALTLTGLLKAYEDKAFDIAPLAETWTTLASNLETVRDLIIEATRPAVLKEVLRDLEDLKGTFDALTAYATELQNLALAGDSKPIQVFTIPLSERAA